MITDILRTETGDVYFPLTIVSGRQAVGQLITRRLRSWKREWWANLTYGLPYRDDLLVKDPRPGIVKACLLSETKKVSGVIDVRNYTESLTNRTMTVSFTAVTEEGDIALELGMSPGAFIVAMFFPPSGIL